MTSSCLFEKNHLLTKLIYFMLNLQSTILKIFSTKKKDYYWKRNGLEEPWIPYKNNYIYICIIYIYIAYISTSIYHLYIHTYHLYLYLISHVKMGPWGSNFLPSIVSSTSPPHPQKKWIFIFKRTWLKNWRCNSVLLNQWALGWVTEHVSKKEKEKTTVAPDWGRQQHWPLHPDTDNCDIMWLQWE